MAKQTKMETKTLNRYLDDVVCSRPPERAFRRVNVDERRSTAGLGRGAGRASHEACRQKYGSPTSRPWGGPYLFTHFHGVNFTKNMPQSIAPAKRGHDGSRDRMI